MAKHRKQARTHVNPLIGGAILAGGLLLAAPAGMAFADPPGQVNGRPAPPNGNPQPGVDAVQEAGDNVFDNNAFLNGTSLGQAYHGLYGNSSHTLQTENGVQVDPSQGLTVGVRNTFPRVVRCNIVVQTAC